MFTQMFRVDAKEIVNKSEHLEMVVPGTYRYLRNAFEPGLTVPQIKTLLDKHFLHMIRNTSLTPDGRLYESLMLILKNVGNLEVEDGLDTGISSRHLRRLFEFYIGATAKSFSNVVRFQNVLKTARNHPGYLQERQFYDAGFFDQAHFIRDFKNFYGTTPGKAIL